MPILQTLKFITDHPLNKDAKLNSILRFMKWQINTIINPYPIIFTFGEKSKLIVSKGMTGATGNFYCGLHEFDDMAFLLHSLRSSDLFLDIGANIGSYTLLGASEVGCQTISFEPIPNTFGKLLLNINLNNIADKVEALNIGLGSKKGKLRFTKSLDTINHVATESEEDTLDVDVEIFDNIVNIDKPTIMKIDVEGFETEVLNGMPIALADENLKVIIIELNGSGKRYGFDEDQIHEKLIAHGFSPFLYKPFQREFSTLEKYGDHNTIYIKDIEFILSRVKNSKQFSIFNKSF